MRPPRSPRLPPRPHPASVHGSPRPPSHPSPPPIAPRTIYTLPAALLDSHAGILMRPRGSASWRRPPSRHGMLTTCASHLVRQHRTRAPTSRTDRRFLSSLRHRKGMSFMTIVASVWAADAASPSLPARVCVERAKLVGSGFRGVGSGFSGHMPRYVMPARECFFGESTWAPATAATYQILA